MQDFLKELQILSPEDCQRAIESLDRLQKHWILFGRDPQRSPQHMFGRALYISGSQIDLYRQDALRLNPLLLENFGWLYQKVFSALSLALDGRILLTGEAGYPGFHIFQKEFLPGGGVVHFDLQQNFFPWENPQQYEMTSPLSFTLPLLIPPEGTGLNFWPIDFQIRGRPNLDPSHLGPPSFIPYKAGHLYFFTRTLLHQIPEKKDSVHRRITLQGHGLRNSRNEWIVYF